MTTVYLSGPISGETYKGASGWRDEVATTLAGAGFRVLNPLRGKSFLSSQQRIRREVYEKWQDPTLSDAALFLRDHADVVASDIILCNLRGAGIISIGSMIELGIAAHLHKLIVVVLEGDNPHNHPFVRHIAVVFHDLQPAVAYVLSCRVEED